MLSYTLRRIALMVPTLLGVAVLTFFLLRVIPGDIVEIKLTGTGGTVSEEQLDAERERLGLNKPLHEQFVDWMTGLARGDLGESMWTGRSVAEEISIRFGTTLQVALLGSFIAVLIAVPLGTAAAIWRGTMIDYIIRVFTIAGLAVPPFWLGMLIILGLLAAFQWLPPITRVSPWEDPLGAFTQLIWPALSVGYRYAAVVARMIRSSILEVMSEDYIRTARAKGVYEHLVIIRHGLRNALLPAITVIGLEFAFLLGGLVVTEQVFNLNGIGSLLIDSVLRNDFTVVQGIVMVIALSFVIVNLLVDLLYAALDPRIRYQT